MDLMVQKYIFGKESYIRQINDIWEWQKITAEFSGKRSCLKRIRGYNTGGKEEEVGTLLLGNDKNNIVFNYLSINLVFVLKLFGLNGYLKDYLKSRINKLPRKNKHKFSVRRCRFIIKDISLLSFLIQHISRSKLRKDWNYVK